MLNKDNSPGRLKVFLWAFLLWTLWVLFYSLIMSLQVGMPYWGALISGAFSYYTFALLSILIWFICKKIPLGKIATAILIAIHCCLAMLLSALWQFLMFGTWYLIEGKQALEAVPIRTFIGWQFLFGMIQYFLIAGISYTIIYYRNLKKKELEEAKLKILTREAELKALKLQMNPHFLFNSLNSINALVTKDPVLARKMIAQLAELLRMSLESHDRLLIPLKQELDLVHRYLAIEQMRFGEKMVFNETIDPALLTRPFPAMLLQPLLENAVKHGIANSLAGGTISLSIRRQNNHLVTSIANEIEEKRGKPVSPGVKNGLSFANIRQRLDRMFPDNYSWQVDQSDPHIFRVEFKLPLTD